MKFAALSFPVLLLAISAYAVGRPLAIQARPVAFNRDIRPILSDKCFACHGPDKNKRQGNLRLDQPNRAVVAGDINKSILIWRITRADNSPALMPPLSFHKKLTAEEKSLLTRWVREGGKYQKHWSYEPPVRAAIPPGVGAIDYLIRKRLDRVGLEPSPPTDREC